SRATQNPTDPRAAVAPMSVDDRMDVIMSSAYRPYPRRHISHLASELVFAIFSRRCRHYSPQGALAVLATACRACGRRAPSADGRVLDIDHRPPWSAWLCGDLCNWLTAI